MRKNRLSALLLCLPLLCAAMLTARAEEVNEVYTVAQVTSLCDGIVAYNGADGEQDFIDEYLTAGAGTTAEFYAIALSQSGDYDFSRYESALLDYLGSHEVYAASSREKYALALFAAGSTDRYIADTADEAIGGLGIMSLVFGLHILNNGCESALYSTDGLVSELLSWQKEDGGWSVMGSYGDVDVTAMTLQALAPHRGRADVGAAVDRAIAFLSSKQLSDGGFKTMGTENCESAAQVVIALSALGLDAQTDGRFVKNGCSAMNGMMRYYLGNGFSHDGSGADTSATTEAYCALVAYLRYCRGQGPLYVLDHAQPVVHAQRSDTGQPDDAGSFEDRGEPGDRGEGGGAHTVADGTAEQNGGSGESAASRGKAADEANKAARTDGLPESAQRSENRDGQNAQEVTDEPVRRDDGQPADRSDGDVAGVNGRQGSGENDSFTEQATQADSGTQNTEPQQQTPSETQASSLTANSAAHGGVQQGTAAAQGETLHTPTPQQAEANVSYKLYAAIGVIAAGGIACAVLFALKKRGKKHFLSVILLTAAGLLFVLLTNFQTPEEHHRGAMTDGEWTVTLTIRCDTVADRASENAFIPKDGIILDTTAFSVSEGDTVYDVLKAAAAENDIPLDHRGSAGSAYIAGINTLYEFEYGDLSGWMYRVNGQFPDVGCESCTFSDGDSIEWLYTTNIGKDLG